MGSYANRFDADYIESLYKEYLENSDRVAPSWRHFFDGMTFAGAPEKAVERVDEDFRVFALIRAYRKWGHLLADLNPLKPPANTNATLDLAQFGFDEADLPREVPTGGLMPAARAPLGELIALLKETYCGRVGVEYLDGSNPEMENWFQEQLEPTRNQPTLSLDEKRWILEKLNGAELFEKFLHKKYVGQKRFSLEGAESLIPCVAEILEQLATYEGSEVVVGMSHRGRLNVLANIMGKSFEEIFAEFEPNYVPNSVHGSGDVKYHKGFESLYQTRTGQEVQVSLADNPSHLEAVCPVVQGVVRAHQSLRHDENRLLIIPLLIHGDASFAGQGMVSETLNMSQLEGFRTGGTIHIIVNNQIGFTTNPEDSRSTKYASDVARQILAPVFHVNGDHPEAVVHVARLASAFRQRFHRDVVIDLVCYRRHGHNEGDEPSFTQPIMYSQIKSHLSPREAYSQQLIAQGELEAAVAQKMEEVFDASLEEALVETRTGNRKAPTAKREMHFQEFKPVGEVEMLSFTQSAVPGETLKDLMIQLTQVPEHFSLNRKIRRIFDQRLEAVTQGVGIDWGCAEHLAFASLLSEGIPCRLTGQDVQRGTFSHRHAVVFDTETGESYTPLSAVARAGVKFSIYNSHLSEQAVLGFEFGYGMARPKSLVIWEAQFGDFSNGAQTIIDQFIASSESKWQRVNHLVMFLPHGYEGQGPEHSSARLERFLQLCAEANIQVCNPTEPAQLFHLLRRQMIRDFRKPLIVMTPKSLLRHTACVSSLEAFTTGGFREVVPDSDEASAARRLVFCSGKLFYELQAAREAKASRNVALIRIEQLYPLAIDQIASIASGYPQANDVVWAQEEPQNMGAWSYIRPRLEALFETRVRYVGRAESASPAVGSLMIHNQEQQRIMEQVFD